MFGGGGGGFQAPKISSIKISSIGQGTPIPLLFGTARVSPVLIASANFKRKEVKSPGGKGGGTGGKSYEYSSDLLFAVCEGEIRGYGKAWRDKDRFDTLADSGFTFYVNGTIPQLAWGHWVTNVPDKALPYSGTALVAGSAYKLNDGATLGNHSFEVFGLQTSATVDAPNHLDAYPKDIIGGFISNPHYGAVDPVSAVLPLDTTAMHDYCKARGIVISPLLDSVRPAHEWLAEWAMIANTGIVWSEGVLKFRPYSDLPYISAAGSYTPDTAIRYHFDADDGNVWDFVKHDADKTIDSYNRVTIECLNRANDYNEFAVTRDDLADIDQKGLRDAPSEKYECIKQPRIAVIVALTKLQSVLYRRERYSIVTDCDADLLEPVDFVALTCTPLGLSTTRCRVKSIKDYQEGKLELIVEEAPTGGYCG